MLGGPDARADGRADAGADPGAHEEPDPGAHEVPDAAAHGVPDACADVVAALAHAHSPTVLRADAQALAPADAHADVLHVPALGG